MRRGAPAVSVCIRAFARPDGLRAAIDSVLAQTFQDFEIVVSDDSRGLSDVVGAYTDPRVRYHRNPSPAGHVANIVTSFGLARGRLLALLDDDDRWLPGFLQAAVDVLERDPEVGIVFADLYLDAGARRLRRSPALAGGRHNEFLHRILDDNPIAPSAAVMRRAVWEQGQQEYPLRSEAVGDATMWIRAALAGWAFHYVDEALATYRLHPAQLSWTPGVQQRTIATYERFRFADPRCEHMRRMRLAEARLAEASTLLWRGRLGAARREIELTRGAAAGPLGARGWLALSGLRPALAKRIASHPELTVAALRGWRRLRPPIYSRPRLDHLLIGVEGWLDMREARALQAAAFRLGRTTPDLAAVEIGSWKGRSTIAIASGLEWAGTGVLHSVDPHNGSRTHALTAESNTFGDFSENVRQARLEGYVRPVLDVSATAASAFRERSVGLLFIDGSHEHEDVLNDIEGWLPRMSDGAVLALHDVSRYAGVRRAVRARVLSDDSGFDQPRFVQNTLFVTRAEHDRPMGRSRWSRRRGRLMLELRRLYFGARDALALRTRAVRGRGG